MTRSLYVEPEAEDELAEAVAWYDQRGEGIGDRLLADVQATLGRVVGRPGTCALVADVDPDLGGRRALCRRFPYAVTFMEELLGHDSPWKWSTPPIMGPVARLSRRGLTGCGIAGYWRRGHRGGGERAGR